jgi:peptide/nickel transport system ATP-binding protein
MILSVKNLYVSVNGCDVLKDITFTLVEGEKLGIVGESGSGKTLLMRSIIGLLPSSITIRKGTIHYQGRLLSSMKERELQKIRGKEIGMVFQDPLTFLNPTTRVGDQIAEGYRRHFPSVSAVEARAKALQLIKEVGIPEPERRLLQFPHELSGGMRQRVLIAIALSASPTLLIADEPTTALDVTVQAQIMQLLHNLQIYKSTLLVSHDLSLVASFCDRVIVMHEGQIVEDASTRDLFSTPRHPYTKQLLRSISSLAPRKIESPSHSPTPTQKQPLVIARHLTKTFPTSQGLFPAVSDVSLHIDQGQTLGLVGESGCGKSTLGRLLLRLLEPTAGTVHFNGLDILSLSPKKLKEWRKEAQIIFQDPYASLNPRMTVAALIAEPLKIHGVKASEEAVIQALQQVGLSPDHRFRYPHQFSGGQRQRIGIARALILNPRLIICDEPITALDVSIQAQIIALLKDLQQQLGLTYLFISHDLRMVKHIADRVAVMHLGKIVEEGPTDEVFNSPQHAYTQTLLSAIPQYLG